MIQSQIWSLSLFFFIVATSCQKKDNHLSGGVPPDQALSTFQLADGFQIELIAAEPLIADPVAMDLDEKGNIYVVEMHGYPLDKGGSGRIVKLIDTDGNGQPDKSFVFAEGLVLPTGIMRWKKGFLVVDVPDVLYLEDTDGDHKSDLRRVILTGFALTNPQHLANTPVYGLDNWIYLAHQGKVTPKVFPVEFGDTGAVVKFVDQPGTKTLPTDANGRNVRFKPDESLLEMMSGDSQYGQTFDEWGHQFLTSNADHLFSEIMAARYLDRNPGLLIAESMEKLPDHGNACEVYPITKNPEHQLLTDVGVITSSCGVTWYNGGLFPDSFAQVTFIAEPVHNLVHADRIIGKGASFTASRVYESKEFLASTDSWFRPAQFYIGPDGALYILDYYRQIIEHPEWMSDEVNQSGALYNGSQQGRIYRITPKGALPMDWCGKLKMDQMTSLQLADLLNHKNGWWRRQAQRLLVAQNDSSVVSILQSTLDKQSFSATGIVHALWTLEGLHQMKPRFISQAFLHPIAGVRENAIRLAELHALSERQLIQELFKLVDDPDAKVRFQLLCTLGSLDHLAIKSVVHKILVHDIEDKWVQLAALSSMPGNEFDLIRTLAPLLEPTATEGRKQFFEQTAAVISSSDPSPFLNQLLHLATRKSNESSAWWQTALLKGIATGLKINPKNFDEIRFAFPLIVSKFNKQEPAQLRTAAIQLLLSAKLNPNEFAAPIHQARLFLKDASTPDDLMIDALSILGAGRDTHSIQVIKSFLDPGHPDLLQQHAIQTYYLILPDEASAYIIDQWKTLTPAVRDAAVLVMMRSNKSRYLLLQAVEKNLIQRSAIDWRRTVQLLNSYTDSIRAYARKILGQPLANRNEVFDKYQPALTQSGDPEKGLTLFKQHCGICHQVGGADGKAIGPDLASIRNREARFILEDILDPNRSLADEYETWEIEKKNGEHITGIISAETNSNLTLVDALGIYTTVPRSDIRSLRATDLSMMPAGFESVLDMDEMADLLSFLKGLK